MELMRDKIAFLQGEQRARYFGKSLPLLGQRQHRVDTGRDAARGDGGGYRACLATPPPTRALAPHAALIAQRVMRYIGAQMLFHAASTGASIPTLDAAAQAVPEAGARGHRREQVKDSLEARRRRFERAEAYVQVVLIQAAYLSEMTAPQMDFARR
jgi:hypothetical protein